MDALIGRWRLISWSAVWAFQFGGPSDEFLYQNPADALPRTDDAGEVRGSILAIGADGSFSQGGHCDRPILTYDEEGVQVAAVPSFGGVVREDGERGYLLGSEARGSASRNDPGRLRWDDGDTRVCDSVRVLNGRLIRTICVVTDECYGDRVVLVYEPC
jgi:hypothetical protein